MRSAITTAVTATSMRNARGHGLSFAYTADRLATVTDAAGRVVTVDSDPEGRVTKFTLPDGRNAGYGYSGGRLTSFRDSTGQTTTYGYDAGGRLSAITDPNGHLVVQNAYDSATGRITAQTDALGKVTTFEWNAQQQVAKTTDPDGVVMYDAYRNNVLLFHQNGNLDLTACPAKRKALHARQSSPGGVQGSESRCTISDGEA
jgi:YD repeat-containing protein